MAPALRMTRSIKEKLPIFLIPYRSFLPPGEGPSVFTHSIYTLGGLLRIRKGSHVLVAPAARVRNRPAHLGERAPLLTKLVKRSKHQSFHVAFPHVSENCDLETQAKMELPCQWILLTEILNPTYTLLD